MSYDELALRGNDTCDSVRLLGSGWGQQGVVCEGHDDTVLLVCSKSGAGRAARTVSGFHPSALVMSDRVTARNTCCVSVVPQALSGLR